MPNPVIHFEIITNEADAAQGFYSEVFGWEVNADNPLNYGAVKTDTEVGIGGGISAPYPGTEDTYATFYVGVESIEETLAKFEASGGSIVMPAMQLPGGSRMAQVLDPFGTRIGLLEGA